MASYSRIFSKGVWERVVRGELDHIITSLPLNRSLCSCFKKRALRGEEWVNVEDNIQDRMDRMGGSKRTVDR